MNTWQITQDFFYHIQLHNLNLHFPSAAVCFWLLSGSFAHSLLQLLSVNTIHSYSVEVRGWTHVREHLHNLMDTGGFDKYCLGEAY